MSVKAVGPDYDAYPELLVLLRDAFEYMAPLLGHPSPVAALTAADLRQAAGDGPVLVVEENGMPVACLFCRASRDIPDAFYIGRLAVAEDQRGRGRAKALVEAANDLARAGGYSSLTLDTGAVLTELHALFARWGFRKVVNSQNLADVTTMIRDVQ